VSGPATQESMARVRCESATCRGTHQRSTEILQYLLSSKRVRGCLRGQAARWSQEQKTRDSDPAARPEHGANACFQRDRGVRGEAEVEILGFVAQGRRSCDETARRDASRLEWHYSPLYPLSVILLHRGLCSRQEGCLTGRQRAIQNCASVPNVSAPARASSGACSHGHASSRPNNILRWRICAWIRPYIDLRHIQTLPAWKMAGLLLLRHQNRRSRSRTLQLIKHRDAYAWRTNMQFVSGLTKTEVGDGPR
jgi:hypothetical protein